VALDTDEILEPFDLDGFLIVKITQGYTINIPVYVHRLVADAFVRPPWRKPRSYTAGVRHVDGDAHNNHWRNLEYTREIERPIDYRALIGSWSDLAMPWKNRPIRCIELDEVFPSVQMASKVLRVGQPNITAQLQGRLPHVSGYSFEYLEGVSN
jgi:hypothetical protein